MKTIHLSEVLSEINKVNSVFSLKYRKADGTVGFKKDAVIRNNSNVENERRKMNRNGLILIFEKESGAQRDVMIDLIIEFNGVRVIRNFEIV